MASNVHSHRHLMDSWLGGGMLQMEFPHLGFSTLTTDRKHNVRKSPSEEACPCNANFTNQQASENIIVDVRWQICRLRRHTLLTRHYRHFAFSSPRFRFKNYRLSAYILDHNNIIILPRNKEE